MTGGSGGRLGGLDCGVYPWAIAGAPRWGVLMLRCLHVSLGHTLGVMLPAINLRPVGTLEIMNNLRAAVLQGQRAPGYWPTPPSGARTNSRNIKTGDSGWCAPVSVPRGALTTQASFCDPLFFCQTEDRANKQNEMWRGSIAGDPAGTRAEGRGRETGASLTLRVGVVDGTSATVCNPCSRAIEPASEMAAGSAACLQGRSPARLAYASG